MSAGEYVVIEVFTPYDGGVPGTWTDGRFLDYSRCTARQAQTFLPGKPEGKFRARHWIGGESLNASQLRRMASDELNHFAEHAPGEGDFWNVTVEYETNEGSVTLRTSVDTWSGPAWDRLLRAISGGKAAEYGWVVKGFRLGN